MSNEPKRSEDSPPNPRQNSGQITPFESIRRTNPAGNEFWSSRDFARVLGYVNYRHFQAVIEKARTACFNSGQRVEDHFVGIDEMVEIGSGAQRAIPTVMMSRYACYLVIQNADPSKEIVAQGQTYFAIQTRRQELSDEEMEEQRRLAIRSELRTHNSQLADAVKDAGVIETRDYAIFQNHGYIGLYGGLGAQDIHARKGLKKGEQILDHMGSTELAANLFRATQAEEKLRREKITGKANANKAHREVGAKVRQTIKELGGTMPEEMPTVESIKKLESKARKALKKPKP
ncbi:MAG: DNA damage-inducible protein D [Spartobacteria bacterium]|nr:DNA damage-inducible protein D [Spartobacteria bacterium]